MKKYAEWTRNTRLKHISLDKENKRVITFWRPNIKIQSLKDSNLSVLQEVNYLENWLCAPEVHKVGAKSRGNTNCPEVKNCSFMFIQYLAQWGTHPKKNTTQVMMPELGTVWLMGQLLHFGHGSHHHLHRHRQPVRGVAPASLSLGLREKGSGLTARIRSTVRLTLTKGCMSVEKALFGAVLSSGSKTSLGKGFALAVVLTFSVPSQCIFRYLSSIFLPKDGDTRWVSMFQE